MSQNLCLHSFLNQFSCNPNLNSAHSWYYSWFVIASCIVFRDLSGWRIWKMRDIWVDKHFAEMKMMIDKGMQWKVARVSEKEEERIGTQPVCFLFSLFLPDCLRLETLLRCLFPSSLSEFSPFPFWRPAPCCTNSNLLSVSWGKTQRPIRISFLDSLSLISSDPISRLILVIFGFVFDFE